MHLIGKIIAGKVFARFADVLDIADSINVDSAMSRGKTGPQIFIGINIEVITMTTRNKDIDFARKVIYWGCNSACLAVIGYIGWTVFTIVYSGMS